MKRADYFIILDDAQFPKGRGGGGGYERRCWILLDDNARWLTVPVRRNYSGTRRLYEIEICDGLLLRQVARRVEAAYHSTPYFDDVWAWLEPCLSRETSTLLEYNLRLICKIRELLDISTPTFRASAFSVVETGTDRIVDLVKAVAGTRYLCGAGAARYQDDMTIERAGIEIERLEYKHPVYEQMGSRFAPGLSIIDALFNVGVVRTREMLCESG